MRKKDEKTGEEAMIPDQIDSFWPKPRSKFGSLSLFRVEDVKAEESSRKERVRVRRIALM